MATGKLIFAGIKRWWGTSGRVGAVVPIILFIAGVGGLVAEQWDVLALRWSQTLQPKILYGRAIDRGIAISLTALESRLGQQQYLPGLDIQGFVWDQHRGDWIIFGNSDSSQPSLPVSAIIVAVHALRYEVESPGIDIRPAPYGDDANLQAVSYFGGVEGTIVGQWFFDFDYWMKRASLGDTAIPISSVTSYWQQSVQQLDIDAASLGAYQIGQSVRRSRFWLCAENFEAIEDSGVLAFKTARLHVLDEEVATANQLIIGNRSIKDGIEDDPLARRFAGNLTKHLDQLDGVTPVRQIQGFAKLMAGLAWLAEVDPYHDLRPWLNASAEQVRTPTSVQTLCRTASRANRVDFGSRSMIRQLRLEVSGGVLMQPSVTRFRSVNNELAMLHDVILAMRPPGQPLYWKFNFIPARSQL